MTPASSCKPRAVVVGAGIMGTVTALELDGRGYDVRLLDAGAIPNPLAASTDISKVVRMEYGADADYMTLAEAARTGWLAWNARWRAEGEAKLDVDPGLYHETGVLMVCLDEMAPGGFEHDSFELLKLRGHAPERIGGAGLAARFPAWGEDFVDGFFHAEGGWVESGRVVAALVGQARLRGVEVLEHSRVESLIEDRGRVSGVSTSDGRRFEAEAVVVAGGWWVRELVTELAVSLRRTYHPVWHLAPAQTDLFEARRFPVFTADIARTGFYGFPLHPLEKVVKIGHHGLGVEPDEKGSGGALTVPEPITAKLREFLRERLPPLAEAPVVGTRLCPYCDTADEDLWIAGHPERLGLTVASGGSGHAFKFAPVLGPVVADAVEGRTNTYSEKFRWRPEVVLDRGREAARCHEDTW